MDQRVTDSDQSVGLSNRRDYVTHPLQSIQTWVRGYCGAMATVDLSPTMETSGEEWVLCM